MCYGLKEELCATVMKMSINKSPGSNGANACFIRSFWNIVRKETWEYLNDFFSSGVMPEYWKETRVVLFPKAPNATKISMFFPISLCQTIYKMAASIILRKLRICLPNIISESQGAFAPERNISSNYLLALDVMNKMRFSIVKPGLMLLKLDMEQSYGSICWEMLNRVTKVMGFLEKILSF